MSPVFIQGVEQVVPAQDIDRNQAGDVTFLAAELGTNDTETQKSNSSWADDKNFSINVTKVFFLKFDLEIRNGLQDYPAYVHFRLRIGANYSAECNPDSNIYAWKTIYWDIRALKLSGTQTVYLQSYADYPAGNRADCQGWDCHKEGRLAL